MASGRFKPILFLPLLFLLAACGDPETDDWFSVDEYHPMVDNIPFYGEEHNSIATGRSLDELDEVPDQIRLLERYLQDPDALQVTARFPVEALRITDLQAIGPDRLLLLDSFQAQLLEHDLDTGETRLISKRTGEDAVLLDHPGRQMVRDGERVSLVGQDGTLHHFDCDVQPCELDMEVEWPFRPVEFARRGDTFAALTTDRMDESADSHPEVLKLVDAEGVVLETFGHGYDTGGEWLLEPPMIEDGAVHYMEGSDRFVVSYDYLPILYSYDGETLELAETYRVKDYLLSRHGFDADERRVMVPMENYTTVRTLPVDENLLLVESDTRVEMEPETEEEEAIARQVRWDRVYRYFLVDLRTGESYHVGDRETPGVEYEQRLFVTEYGIALYDQNDQGVTWMALGG